jgi:alkylhydroperoxidase family enzyme
MAWIRQIEIDDADGLLARLYKSAVQRTGRVFGIVKLQSLNPPVLQSGMTLYGSVMHGKSPLSRAQREMLATVVSRINECHY